MDFLYIKALHLIFVVSWFAGLFYIVRLFVYHVEAEKKEEPVATRGPQRSDEPLVLTPENAAAAAPKQVDTASTLSAKILMT